MCQIQNNGGVRIQVIIRAACEQDYEEIFPLLQELWKNRDLDKEALHKVFRNALVSPQDFAFVAEIDGKATGFTAGVISNCYYHAGILCFISVLVVNEGARGRGIGTKLLNHVEYFSQEMNCDAIELDSNFYREKAHAFYERFGFAKRAYTFTLDKEKIKEHLSGKTDCAPCVRTSSFAGGHSK